MSRRLRRVLLVFLTLLVTGVLATFIVIQSDWLRDRLRRLAISQAAQYLTGTLTIGRLSGSLFHDVVLDDVTLTQADGLVMHAARVSVKYDWRVLVQRHLVLDDLLVERPSLRIAEGPAGWNVGHLLRKRDTTGAPLVLLIDRLWRPGAAGLVATTGLMLASLPIAVSVRVPSQPAGFLRVVDESTLGFVDYAGNRQYITQGNLADNPKALLFLIDYAHRQRVKIWGTARVLERDSEFVAKLMPEGYRARPEQVILFTVSAWNANCAQHIPQRFEAADVAAAIAERDKRIEALEAEVRRLRGESAVVPTTTDTLLRDSPEESS